MRYTDRATFIDSFDASANLFVPRTFDVGAYSGLIQIE